MTDRCFLDTNIIVYGFDKENDFKRTISKDLINKIFFNEIFFISTQVIGEFCNIADKKIIPKIPLEKVENFISTFPEDVIISIKSNDIIKALRIKEKYQYSFWDSLILSSAINSGCSILYSEDLQSGQLIEDQLKIINPYI